MRVRNRLFTEWLVASLITLGLVAYLVQAGATDRIDSFIYDRVEAFASVPASDRIVIVAIDEDSLARIGRWPWPRAVHTELLTRLTAARVAAVGYDVLFLEPGDPAQDAALARAVAANGQVHLPVYFQVPGADGRPFDRVPPVPGLAAAARALDHVNLTFDPDGVVRRLSLIEGSRTVSSLSLSESIYRQLGGGAPSPAFARAIPADLSDGYSRARPILIPFAGPPGAFSSVSFASVLAGEVPAEFLRGRIVLVGSTAAGSGDQYPVSGRHGVMAGVEVHANALNALLADRTIAPVGLAARFAAAMAPVALMLGCLLFFSPRGNLLTGIGLIIGTMAVTVLLLRFGGAWVPPGPALIGLAIIYPLWAWRRLTAVNVYFVEELSRLASESDPLPHSPAARVPALGDAIARQSMLLQGAIGRVRALRRFFDDALQGLPDATFVTDADDRILIANASAEPLIAQIAEPDRALTKMADVLRRLDPTCTSIPIGEQREIAAPFGATYLVRSALLRDATGAPAGAIVRLTDITDFKIASRQREQVLQLLTHDMRSPQASILALLDQSPKTSAEDGAFRDRIARYAHRTLKLADDFVMLARAESSAYRMETVNLADLLIEAADDLWPDASRRGMRIAVAGDDVEWLVEGDRSLLGRVLGNLIGNAIKYGEGGTAIDCAIFAEGSSICCAVTNHGDPIPADRLSQLFQPFSRLGAGRGPAQLGAGLGLAFVKSVAERHGGEVVCRSEAGAGTTFTLCLPAAATEEAL